MSSMRVLRTTGERIPRRGEWAASFLLPISPAMPTLPYDERPAPGVPRAVGATVDVIYTNVTTRRTYRHPAYWFIQTGRGDRSLPLAFWRAHLSPPEAGNYTWAVSVTSKEFPRGTRFVPPENRFSVSRNWGSKGIVRRSSRDARLLGWEDGTPVLPLPGVNLMYSTAWKILPPGTFSVGRDWWQGSHAPLAWSDIAGQGGGVGDWKEFMTGGPPGGMVIAGDNLHLAMKIKPRYPDKGGSLTELQPHPDYLDLCKQPGRRFRVRVTAKTNGAAPADRTRPYGVTLALWRNHPYPDPDRVMGHLVSPGRFATMTGEFSSQGQGMDGPFLCYLDNSVAGSTADVLEWHLHEIDQDGRIVSGELAKTPWIGVDTRMNPWAASNCDQRLRQIWKQGLVGKIVLFERESLLNGYRLDDGRFGDSGYHNEAFYRRCAGKDERTSFIKWLTKARIRYFLARYGWCPAVGICELLNEGSPDDASHFEMLGWFDRVVKSIGEHDKLTSTSTWHSVNIPWMNAYAPGVEIADLHSQMWNFPAGFGNMTPSVLAVGAWRGTAPRLSLRHDDTLGTVLTVDTRKCEPGAGNQRIRLYEPLALPLAPGRRYRVSCQMRCTNGSAPLRADSGLHVFGAFHGDRKGQQYRWPEPQRTWGTGDYGRGREWLHAARGRWYDYRWVDASLVVPPAPLMRYISLDLMVDWVAGVIEIAQFRLLDVTDPAHPVAVPLPVWRSSLLRSGKDDVLAAVSEFGTRFGRLPSGKDRPMPGKVIVQGEENHPVIAQNEPIYADPKGLDPTYVQRAWALALSPGVAYVCDWDTKWLDTHPERWIPYLEALRSLLKGMDWGSGRWRPLDASYDGTRLDVFGQKDTQAGRALLLVRNNAYYPRAVRDARNAALKSGADPFAPGVGGREAVTAAIAIPMPDSAYRVQMLDPQTGKATASLSLQSRGGVMRLPIRGLRTWTVLSVKKG